MFYGNSIETIVKEYNGEDLCKLNIEFDEENYELRGELTKKVYHLGIHNYLLMFYIN